MNKKNLFLLACAVFIPTVALATTGGVTVGTIADNLKTSITSVGSLITAVSVVAGIGFGVAAMFKFKQHKDNPTQVPLGQPLAFLSIAVLLVWLPFILASGGTTMGTDATGTAGTEGKAPDWLKSGG